MQLRQRFDGIRDLLFYEEGQQRRKPEVDWVPVRQAQLALLMQQHLAVIILAAVTAVALWALVYWLTRSPWCLVWAALFHSAQFSRASVTTRALRQGLPPQRLDAVLREQTLFLWLLGGIWALAPWMLVPQGDMVVLLYVTVFVIGYATSSVAVLASHVQTVIAIAVPSILGLIARTAYFSGPIGWVLAVLLLLHLFTVVRWSAVQVGELERSLRTGFQNQALAEQLARQMQEVQRASDEKTRFLAAASHDLRQPVHAIGLFGAVLERELRNQPQHTDAELLMRAVDALGFSLDAMLNVSHLDAGLIEPAVTATPLNPILQSLGQIFASQAEEKGLQLRVRATPLWARTDGELLQRMLANLIENGLKYTPAGGVLVLARARGAQVWIDVADNGIGIAPEHQEQVFAEFYQIDNPGRDRSRGLGMGLSIVRRLSQLLDHPVQLHSRLGHGSRFRLVLPAASTAPAQPAESESRAMRGALSGSLPARHLLLVEDEDDIAHAMTALLRTHGIRLSHAATPERAEQLVTEMRAAGRPFDAAICDLRLAEGASGLALALDLHAREGAALPVLLITGETAPAPLQRVRDTGLPVLFKPVTAPALMAALAHLLQGTPQ
ncbi:MAG: response regulator [Burkholderiaceae bacterium]|jgi:signal transduction histidine kinase/ActR/RegA family two-component response regulator|nr:response regulator [Burkholderiaceae bacterium]